jgi:protein required for attachment to host cells
MKPTRTWILIANGGVAGILEHTGPGHGLVRLENSWTAEPEAEFADRPGRSFKRLGPLRHGFEPHGAGGETHEAFARVLAADLSRLRQENRFDRLIICAPPSMLGSLRKHLGDPLKADITAEIPKDLMNVPAAKLPAHFSKVLAV